MDDVKLKPLSSYGEHMSVKEFASYVKVGAFIPDDGDGYWATETEMSDLCVWSTRKPEWATHVMWYNR